MMRHFRFWPSSHHYSLFSFSRLLTLYILLKTSKGCYFLFLKGGLLWIEPSPSRGATEFRIDALQRWVRIYEFCQLLLTGVTQQLETRTQLANIFSKFKSPVKTDIKILRQQTIWKPSHFSPKFLRNNFPLFQQ